MRAGAQETDLMLPVEDLPRRRPSPQAKVVALSERHQGVAPGVGTTVIGQGPYRRSPQLTHTPFGCQQRSRIERWRPRQTADHYLLVVRARLEVFIATYGQGAPPQLPAAPLVERRIRRRERGRDPRLRRRPPHRRAAARQPWRSPGADGPARWLPPRRRPCASRVPRRAAIAARIRRGRATCHPRRGQGREQSRAAARRDARSPPRTRLRKA